MNFVVIESLDALRYATKLRMFLCGGNVVQSDYIFSRGANGARLVYTPAVSIGCRQVWVSARWLGNERNQALYAIIDEAISLPCSKWRWFVGNSVEFVQRAARKNTSVIGLVTNAERVGFPIEFKSVFTNALFLNEVCKLSSATQTAMSSGK